MAANGGKAATTKNESRMDTANAVATTVTGEKGMAKGNEHEMNTK